MKKAIYILATVIIIGALLVGVLVYQTLTVPGNQHHFYGFESGFSGWTTGADVPDDPNNPGNPVNWTIELVDDISHGGNQSVRFFIDGTQDDGTIWIQRKIFLTPSSVSNVSVSFQLWSPSESFNTIANTVGYMGTKNATVEGDFQTLGAANQVEGWKAYKMNGTMFPDSSGDAYIAVGISVTWETQMTYYIDDVTVDIN